MVARQKKENAVKLTLYLSDDVIIKAKIHALERKKSLSDVVEELLRRELGLVEPGNTGSDANKEE